MAASVDLPGADPTRTQRFEVVGENDRDDHEGHGTAAAAHALEVDGPPPGEGVGGDDQRVDAVVDRPAERLVDRSDRPARARVALAQPARESPPAGGLGGDRPPPRLRVVGQEPPARQADRHRAADVERCAQERLVAGMEPVERPPQDDPPVPAHDGP
jgi:hypothetical protein